MMVARDIGSLSISFRAVAIGISAPIILSFPVLAEGQVIYTRSVVSSVDLPGHDHIVHVLKKSRSGTSDLVYMCGIKGENQFSSCRILQPKDQLELAASILHTYESNVKRLQDVNSRLEGQITTLRNDLEEYQRDTKSRLEKMHRDLLERLERDEE